MDKKFLFLILLGTLVLSVIPLSFVSAQLVRPQSTYYSLGTLIANIETLIWVVFGVVVVVCFVIAGIMFLTAQGAPDKLTTARHAFIWGIAGVVVGILAYSIITIVSNLLAGTASTNQSGIGGPCPCQSGLSCSNGVCVGTASISQ